MDRFAIRLAVAGAFLGLGAPIGAFFLQVLREGSFSRALAAGFPDHRFFYVYMALGTSLVFSCFGFLAGRFLDRAVEGRERFRGLSERDELTGLLNRRAFEAALRSEIQRSQRTGTALGCLYVDLDDFKRFNDRYGHAAGDEVLKGLGRVLGRVGRSTDVVCRVGGDEFALLAPGAGEDAVASLAERVRLELEKEPFDIDGLDQQPTVTVGAASALDDEGQRGLVAAADASLLSGKARRKQALPASGT